MFKLNIKGATIIILLFHYIILFPVLGEGALFLFLFLFARTIVLLINP